MKKYIFIFFFLFILIGCNKIYQNREQDKQQAEKVTEEFYKFAKNDNIIKAFPLFSNNFFKVTDKNTFSSLFEETNRAYGKILKDSLINFETLVTEGNEQKGEYLLIYSIKREITDSEEYLTLRKENNKIKIFDYRVNIDTLAKKKKKPSQNKI